MKTAILYTRVSSADQVSGTSLETQEKDIRDWCRRNGYEVLGHFQDAGESAKTMDRPGLQNALEEARKQRASAFVVWKLDRLSRDTQDGLGIRASLAKHGCELVSLAEPAGSDPMGQMVSTIMFAVAQFDNEQRGQRCKRGMVETVAKGGWVWRDMVGFDLGRSGNIPILIPKPPLSNIIQGVLRGFLSGATTKSQGIAELKRAGLPANVAHRCFKLPVYGGILRNKLTDGKDVLAAFPGLVTPEEWYRLEEMVAPPKQQIHVKHNDDFPLTGILLCGECGAQLWGYFAKSKTGRKYPYYRCRKNHINVRACKIDAQLFEIFDKSKLLAAVMKVSERKFCDMVLERMKAESEKMSETRKNITLIDARIIRLTNARVDGKIDEAAYKAAMAAARQERANDHSALELSKNDFDFDTEFILFKKNLENMRTIYGIAGTENKKKLLKLLFGSLRVEKEAFTLEPEKDSFLLNFSAIFEDASYMVGATGLEPVTSTV